jgi:DNA-binding transcriptional LysR family regulator
MKPDRERLADVEVFVRAVEAGNFSAAARAMGVTPSAVSKGVARLEARLGVRLLQRTTRTLGLTQQGRLFHERARRALVELDDAEAALAKGNSGVRGALRVSAPVGLGNQLVGQVAQAVVQKHPDLRIELSLTDRRVELIDERVDVAVRVGALPDSSLVARRLGAVRFVVCAAPAYLRRRGVPRAPAELSGHACLRFLSGGVPLPWAFLENGRVGSMEVSGPLDSDSGEVLRNAAVNGLGLMWSLDVLAAKALATGRLRAVLRPFAAPEVPVHALFPSARNLAPAVHVFIEALAASCRQQLGAEGKG